MRDLYTVVKSIESVANLPAGMLEELQKFKECYDWLFLVPLEVQETAAMGKAAWKELTRIMTSWLDKETVWVDKMPVVNDSVRMAYARYLDNNSFGDSVRERLRHTSHGALADIYGPLRVSNAYLGED